jgi:hypothetical protein
VTCAGPNKRDVDPGVDITFVEAGHISLSAIKLVETGSQASVNNVIQNDRVDLEVPSADTPNNANYAAKTNADDGVDHPTSVDKAPAPPSDHPVNRNPRNSKCEIM